MRAPMVQSQLINKSFTFISYPYSYLLLSLLFFQIFISFPSLIWCCCTLFLPHTSITCFCHSTLYSLTACFVVLFSLRNIRERRCTVLSLAPLLGDNYRGISSYFSNTPLFIFFSLPAFSHWSCQWWNATSFIFSTFKMRSFREVVLPFSQSFIYRWYIGI